MPHDHTCIAGVRREGVRVFVNSADFVAGVLALRLRRLPDGPAIAPLVTLALSRGRLRASGCLRCCLAAPIRFLCMR